MVLISPKKTNTTPHVAEIIWVEHIGSKSIVDLRLKDSILRVMTSSDDPVTKKQTAWFGFDPKLDYLLDPQTGKFFDL